MRNLIIGDVHATAEDLEDCEALLGLVFDSAKSLSVDRIIFLGDLHHNHAVTHVSVTEFWLRNLKQLAEIAPISALLGNHDMPNGASRGDKGYGEPKSHALMPYRELSRVGVTVVDSPLILGDFMYVPYVDSEEVFLSAVKALKRETGCPDILICHQTFSGAQYENGFYAKDGFSIEKVQAGNIISGHVHLPSHINKVWYPGAPRWKTFSDANTERAIWLFDPETGELTPIDTGTVCSKIFHFKVENGVLDQSVFKIRQPGNHRYHIDLHGDAEANAKTEEYVLSLNSRVKIRRFDKAQNLIKLKESDGVDKAFETYLSSFKGKNGTPGSEIMSMVSKRIRV